MIKNKLALTCFAVLTIVFAANAQADKKTTFVPVQGNFYEVAKIDPTIARIKSLKLPAGFQINKFAEIENPRMMAVGADGTIYVSSRDAGTLRMLKDTDGDGAADVQKVVAEKKQLHGIAVDNGKAYIVTVKELFVADIKPDGSLGELKMLLNDLPDAGQHPNRTLNIHDGKIYLQVGSTCNACDESNKENATILEMNLDGSGRRIYASGLRNTIGFGWHPVSGKFYGWDQGIDWLGDNEQGEEFNEIIVNQKYGWPYSFGAGEVNLHPKVPAPIGLTNEDWAKQSKQPDLLYTAHSAGMQMQFYTGAMFPAEYKNDAFIALRGSWNRNPPSGYELARVHFDKAGRPTKIEPFLTGFLVKGAAQDGKDAQFARLCGVAILKDGSLLVSDDTNNIIYRITYNGKNAPAMMTRDQITMNLPETASAPNTLKVSSSSFANNGAIPDENSSYYADSSPQLSWSNATQNAKSFAVMLEDPDAALKPTVHWLVANLPANTAQLDKNQPKTDALPNGAIQGGNITGKIGYYGPHPPPADKPHNYHFQVFALDTTLKLPIGFNRQALLDAMKNHVVAKGEIVGTYQRKPDVRDKQ